MADDNKPVKYARYAIGEIVLVVIGILIALQINNWNEDRKDNNTQVVFIEGLILNLDEDIDALNFAISTNVGKMESITYISNLFYNQNDADDQSRLNNHLINMWGVEFYSNQDFVFDGIKSSGKLNLIESDELLFEILSYYHTNNEISRKQEMNNTNINSLMFDRMFMSKIDINSVVEPLFSGSLSTEYGSLDYSFFNQNPNNSEVKEFRNTLSAIKGFISINNGYLEMLRTKALNLRSELALYLNTIDTKKAPIGEPDILVNGKAIYHEVEVQDAGNLNNWFEIDSDKININYPKNLNYGVIRFIDSKIKSRQASGVDYSGYKSITLELKGKLGGESISIAFLDTDDFADGSEISVPLVLTDQWSTYEIGLDKFHQTNFSSIIESPVIVLARESENLSFSIKNIELKE